MAHLLRVAEVATGATEAVLHEWGVAEGASYAVGDVLATLETDKAVVDIEAEDDGVLVVRLVPEGQQAAVGAPIALLAAPGERVADVEAELARLGVDGASHEAAVGSAASSAAVDPGPVAADASGVAEAERAKVELGASADRAPEGASGPARTLGGGTDPAHPERIFASPLARRMARDADIAVEHLVGTGPGGRIVKRDVRNALARQAEQTANRSVVPTARAASTRSDAPAAPAFVDVPHSGVRRATAARLTESKRTAPHFYLRAGVQVDELIALRGRLMEAGVKVSLNDLVVRAVALAHVRVPAMNAIWMPDSVRTFSSVDVAVAVSTERGLLTPVLRGVDSMSVPALAEASRDLVARARSGGLRQHELEGGTITVTNLGMFGVEEFTAIINPPQSAILAIGAVRPQPVVRDCELTVGSVMRVVLAVDHRPVDGTVAAEWLQGFVQLLEEPVRLLL